MIFRRTTTLLLIIVSLIASVIFYGCDQKGKPTVLATVGDSVFTYDLLQYAYDNTKKKPSLTLDEQYEMKKSILDNIVEKQLLAFAAYDSGYHELRSFAKRLEIERDDIYIHFMQKDLISSKSTAEDSDFAKFAINLAQEVNLGILKLNLPFDSVNMIYEKLMNGEDLAKLALNYSWHSYSKNKGGITGYNPITYLSRHQKAVIETLEVDGYSKPFLDGDHYWIIKLLGKRREEIDTEELKNIPNRRLIESKKSDSLAVKLKDILTNKYKVEIDTEVIEIVESKDWRKNRDSRTGRKKRPPEFTADDLNLQIAEFNNEPITVVEFIDSYPKIKAAYHPVKGDMESYKPYIQELVYDKMMVLYAIERGYNEDQRFLNQWKLTYLKLMTDKISGAVLYADLRVSDEEMKTEYENNRDQYKSEFERAKRDILRLLLQEKRTNTKKNFLNDLRKKYKITVDYDRLKELINNN
ncbi:MAG: hypothetical protein GY855_14830 [candidate division Zixibacteria bacterium]|nr:hypothetical protein [candidate division Zixibacteria bacterium]